MAAPEPPILSGIVNARVSSTAWTQTSAVAFRVTVVNNSDGTVALTFLHDSGDEVETRSFKLPQARKVEASNKGNSHVINIKTTAGSDIQLQFTSASTQARWLAMLKPPPGATSPSTAPKGLVVSFTISDVDFPLIRVDSVSDLWLCRQQCSIAIIIPANPVSFTSNDI